MTRAAQQCRNWYLVTGIANERSIAYAIAQQLLQQENNALILSVASEREFRRVQKLFIDYEPSANQEQRVELVQCNISSHEERDALSDILRSILGTDKLNGLVHSIAGGAALHEKNVDGELRAHDLLSISDEAMSAAWQISVLSLQQLCQICAEYFSENAAVVALTYQGSQRVAPGYDVMGVCKAALESSVRYLAHSLGQSGVRVNAISAGSIRTSAAAAVPGFAQRHEKIAEKAPLRRSVEAREVASAVDFLLSPAASGITGQVLHVDAGYSVLAP